MHQLKEFHLNRQKKKLFKTKRQFSQGHKLHSKIFYTALQK